VAQNGNRSPGAQGDTKRANALSRFNFLENVTIKTNIIIISHIFGGRKHGISNQTFGNEYKTKTIGRFCC
jgi:hypothetical protein